MESGDIENVRVYTYSILDRFTLVREVVDRNVWIEGLSQPTLISVIPPHILLMCVARPAVEVSNNHRGPW